MYVGDPAVDVPLYEHQSQCLELSKVQDRWGYILDTGTGKTRLGLCIALDGQDGHGHSRRKTLVLTKLSIITTWIDECRELGMELNIMSGWGKTKAQRRSSMARHDWYDVLVMNYDSFKLETERLKAIGFDTLICDESSVMKSPTTRQSKAVVAFSKHVRRCYLMTATPAPNGEHEWFAQMQCMRDWSSETAPGPFTEKSYYGWQRRWFYQPTPFQPYLWKLDPALKEDFVARIKTRCTFIEKSDCLDLPPQVFELRESILGDQENEAYTSLESSWIWKNQGVTVMAENTLVEAMKLRQITGGWSIPTRQEDEEGERVDAKPQHLGQSKVKVLTEVVKELNGQQAIVFFQFRHEAQMLKLALSEANVTSDVIHGGVSGSAREEVLDLYRAGKIQVLLGHPMCIGHGLNLQYSSNIIWYSLAYSPEIWKQANDRIHRAGQQKTSVYYVICARTREGAKTIDHTIYDSLRKKTKLSKDLLDMLK